MGQDWLHEAPDASLVAHGLVLRRWAREDLDAVTQSVTASREHLAPWMSWATSWDPRDSEDFLRSIIAAWDALEDFTYAVWDGEQLVGAVGLHPDRGPNRLEMGYWVHVDHVGRGVARRACAAALHAAFRLDAVEAIEIRHADTNVRSARVPEALGFRQVGTVPRDRTEEAGDTDVTVVWELGREDVATAAPA